MDTPIADRLRDLIANDGRTQREIAEAAGLAQSQISIILTGQRPNPSVATVGKILAALGLPWGALDDSPKKSR